MNSVLEKKQNIIQNKHHSSSDSENDIKPTESELLTDDQMNELGAKIVKAEILGNDVGIIEFFLCSIIQYSKIHVVFLLIY